MLDRSRFGCTGLLRGPERGEADRAFEWLDKAARYHDLYFSAVAGHPMFNSIHSDPRWLPFLRKHGLAPEQLAAIEFDVKVPK